MEFSGKGDESIQSKVPSFLVILSYLYLLLFIIHVICVVHLFFHSSELSKLPQSIHHSYKPIGIYRQYYILSKRPISRKLGIQQINSAKFTILSIISVRNFSLVTFLAPKPRFVPKPGNNTIFAHKILSLPGYYLLSTREVLFVI